MTGEIVGRVCESLAMIRNTKTKLDQPYVNCEDLGDRWRCHPMTAKRRLLKLGVKPLKMTQRSVLFRMKDVERIEAQAAA